MNSFAKVCFAFLCVFNLAACSYSPETLREVYNDFPSEISGELKDVVNFSADQEAQIDRYATDLIKWHRRHKLPEYAQIFSRLSLLVKQKNFPLPALKVYLDKIENMPHFEQAVQLSNRMAVVARSLSNRQILQLESSLNSEHAEEMSEIRQNSLVAEIKENTVSMFKFLGINLSKEQLQIIAKEAIKRHDIRSQELVATKNWNKQLITLLKQRSSPQFTVRFVKLWSKTDSNKLSGKVKQLYQQNQQMSAVLLQKLISSMNESQQKRLSHQLKSISETFAMMSKE